MNNPSSFGIYIHWPFCLRKCPYCDFNSQARSTIPHEHMQAAYRLEWERQRGEVASGRLVSIYFGGGTPSLMRPADIAGLLELIGGAHSLDGVEITLEANPSSVLPAFLKGIRAAGVNRLSVGVQSFDDKILRFLGRIHSGREAAEALVAARRAGFDKLGLDLILAALPATLETLNRDLDMVGDFTPEHVSAYLLGIEAETEFGRRARSGEELLRPDREARGHFETCRDRLKTYGFEHYEISNFAREDRRSIHNQLYWAGNPYLGLGPGAHSYFPPRKGKAARRMENLRNPDRYIESQGRGLEAFEFEEELSALDLAKEAVMTGLRRLDGIGEGEFKLRCGLDLEATFGRAISTMLERRWLTWKVEGGGRRLRLTEEGVLFSNDVFLEFF